MFSPDAGPRGLILLAMADHDPVPGAAGRSPGAYAAFLRHASGDADVVGLVLMGSRGAGAYVTEASDHDLIVVVRGDVERWQTPHGAPVETWPMSLEQFRSHGLPGSDDAWNRPAFLDATVVLDRLDGEIARLTREKGVLTADEAESVAATGLGDYLNSLYRSLRNLEAGRDLEGRLDALESIGPLLTTVFALEGRVRPFNKWLRLELTRRPLALDGLLDLVERIASDPTTEAQRAAFRRVEAAARAAGHGAIVDGWRPDVDWLRGEPG